MRKSRLICGLSLALAFGPAYGASLPWDTAPQPEPAKYLLIRMKSDDPEMAARAVEGLGKLDGRLRGDARIRVKLNPGVSHEEAIKVLYADDEVALAMEMSQFDEIVFHSTSLDVMKKRVAYLREKADARPQSEKDKVIALQKIRNEQIGIPGLPEVKKSYKGTGLGYYEARKYHIAKRAMPNDTIDNAAYYRAVEHREAMAATEISAEPTGELASNAVSKVKWEFIGPRNLDAPYNIYFGVRPAAGRVNAIAYQPSTPTKLYAAAAGGGLWKSTDSGANWTALGDKWPFMNVSSIAVQSFGEVLYVGTGDFPGWGGYGFGLMKSLDGGATWAQLGTANDFDDYAVSDILISPDNVNNILVTLGRGALNWGSVYRSTNGGTTWTQVIATAGLWSDLSAGVKGPNGEARYIWAGASGGILRRSSDDGLTWTNIVGPFNTGNPNYPMDVAASTVSRNTVYVMDNVQNRVYKSTNAGTNWTDITGNLDPGPGGYNFSQSWYDTHLTVVRRNNQDALYAGLVDIQQCTDLTGNWRTLGFGFTQGGNPTRVHVDHHFMTFHPTNPNEGLASSDGGVYRFDYNATNDTWTFTGLNAQLGVTQFYAFDVHPTNPDIILGGTQDNSSPATPTGDLANWENVAGGDGGYTAINPVTPANQYATSQFLDVYKTEDSWINTQYISPSIGGDSVLFIAPIEIDYNAPDNLYAGTNYLWRYNKSTNSWTSRLGAVALAPSGTAIQEITIAPGASNRIYVGTGSTPSEPGRVWYSNNSGANWTQINTGSPSLPHRWITSISVNPNNINDILVGVAGTGTGHLWRCADVTAPTRVWTNVSGSGLSGLPDITLNDVIRDPDDPATSWHVATDIGVFTTFNGGSTWTNSTNPLGLPNVQCNMLKLQGRNLFVATFGRGIWRVELPSRNAASNLTFNKSALNPSETATGTVTIASPAGASGEIVALSSNHASLTVPATVTVPSGQTTVNFTAVCVNVGDKVPSKLVTVTASRPGSVRSATITTRINLGDHVKDTMTNTVFAGEQYPTWIYYQNNGGTSWTQAAGYELISRNPTLNTIWGPGTDRIPVAANWTVAPGAQFNFFKMLTAPTTLGNYSFQWSPNQVGVNNFNNWSPSRTIQVVANPHGAQFVSQVVPSTLQAGNDFNVELRFRNTGTTTWTNATQFWLYSQWITGNYSWITNQIRLPNNVTVAPGQEYTFTRSMTAPLFPGTHPFSWRMTNNNVGFGQWSPIVNVAITQATDNSVFTYMNTPPTTVAPGAQFTLNIFFKNLGTSTWTAGAGYKMVSYWPQGHSNWGVSELPVATSIAPGAHARFLHTYTAPTTPGQYIFQWRMHKGAVGFGNWTQQYVITVQ